METESPNLNAALPSTITVAIVEDDVSIRDTLVHWIKRARDFACVGEFPDTESAVANIVSCEPQVALVDVNLPGLSGIECVRTLKPLMPATQFVMLTVYEDATHIFDALSAGATGYLLKHTPREALIAALREVHSGGSPMTSNIARKVVMAFQKMGSQKSVADDLSPREREVLELLARGYLYKEIAESLHISMPTVNTYIRRIYEKLHVRSRSQAVAKFTHIPGAAMTE